MNKLAIGMVALVAFGTFVLSYAPKRGSGGDLPALQTPAAVSQPPGDGRVPAAAGTIPPFAISTGVDTTGLLRESLSVADLLEEVNGDTGPEFTPVDRERFAAELRSDPDLRDALDH